MKERVYVWDRFVRLFHWSLVGLVILSYVSGEEEHWIHIYSGYAIATLLVLRLVWGVIGTPYARFSQFVYSPKTVLSYMKSMMDGHPKRYLGHNPAGGVMVLALLLAVLVTAFSGMNLYALEAGKGPLSSFYTADTQPQSGTSKPETAKIRESSHKAYDSDHDEEGEDDQHEYEEYGSHNKENKRSIEFWHECHELAVNALILLILIHLLGVILSSYQHKEKLILSMINGYKRRK